ncbi:selenium cofactor biosynthesis protein YqeC [Clostridium sp.]|uniref:selenium cofactor biosynthesis protein YqeC n=1 Tax=Clostridium sp. TaxID=1506 RepID=UPI003F40D965
MNLFDIIDTNKDDIVTVVGAGGKTSLINYLAKHYQINNKVLVTTTTKIYKPDNEFKYTMYLLDDNTKIQPPIKNGIVVCGQYINNEEKIVGMDFEELDRITPKFDLSLIEGDGSKMKKIKGWNNNEPVVYPSTKKTIGILDITSYDMDINEVNIHRLDELKKITNINKNEKINFDNLCDIVLNDNGMFKNAMGENVLFINKVENTYYENIAKDLIENIKNKNKTIDKNINIVYGSIKQGIIKRG